MMHGDNQKDLNYYRVSKVSPKHMSLIKIVVLIYRYTWDKNVYNVGCLWLNRDWKQELV